MGLLKLGEMLAVELLSLLEGYVLHLLMVLIGFKLLSRWQLTRLLSQNISVSEFLQLLMVDGDLLEMKG